MQPKTSRGVRHLLVATGVVSLALSAAAPAALAAGHSQRSGGAHVQNAERGTTRTLVCHQGRVLEVDDDGAAGGHQGHGDAVWDGLISAEVFRGRCVQTAAGAPGDEGDPLDEPVDDGEEDAVQVCRDGRLETIELVDLGEDEVGIVASETGREASCETAGEDLGGEGTDELEEASGGGETTDPTVGSEEPTVEHEGVGSTGEAPDDAAPPAGGSQQGPPVISAVTVTRPLEPATPAAPTPAVPAPAAPVTPAPAAPAPGRTAATEISARQETAVLGDVTTRIPSAGAGALDPGVRTSALAVTGLDHTATLAVLGSVLLLGGLALMFAGRTRVRRVA